MPAPADASSRRRVPRALLGGALTALSVPPFGWWPLAFVGIAVLVESSATASPARRALLGAAFGCGLYGISLWWMTSFSLPGGLFVVVLEATFTGVGLALTGRVSRFVAVPVGLVLADALRSLWPFGGLPLGGIDLGQAGGPLAHTVALGGRLLLIGATTAAGSAVALLVRGRARVALMIAAAITVVGSLGIVVPDGTHPIGTRRVAAVQGGGPRGLRASDQGTIRAYRAHLDASRDVLLPVDLILWPEDIVAVTALATSPELRDLQSIARRARATVIVGVVEDGPPRRFVNEAVVIEPDGTIGQRFEKVRRVPYGEFFPLRSIIERLGLAQLPARDAIAGHGPGVIRTPAGTFAIAISYEAFFDDRSRSGVRAGGAALLIPTNAASYTTSQVPTQQVAAARLRAIETGRWVLQAAPTGPSALIDHRGHVLRSTTLGSRAVISSTIGLRRGLTPYARWNDTPALLLTAAAWLAARVRDRAAQSPKNRALARLLSLSR